MTATPVSSASIFTSRVRGEAPDRFDIAHEPRQHVDVVHGLIHEDAAVVRPRAAPGFRVVVRLVALPSEPYGARARACRIVPAPALRGPS